MKKSAVRVLLLATLCLVLMGTVSAQSRKLVEGFESDLSDYQGGNNYDRVQSPVFGGDYALSNGEYLGGGGQVFYTMDKSFSEYATYSTRVYLTEDDNAPGIAWA